MTGLKKELGEGQIKNIFWIFEEFFLSLILSLLGPEEEEKFLNHFLKDSGWKTHALVMRIAHDMNGLLRDLESTLLVTLR